MRIVVCVKQVPVVSAMTFDPTTRTLKRDGVASEVSSFDLRALSRAVDLRGEHGGEVVVITMGPPQAREALLECLALGADRAVHLCDQAFAGADTLATARALALALKREPFDLILCGRFSVDAETAQVGPELAELLDIPQITSARSLVLEEGGQRIRAQRETDDGAESVVAGLPVLVTATEDLAPERFPSKAQREAAKAKPCDELTASDLSGDSASFGQKGSPTWVDGLLQMETHRLGKTVEAPSIEAATAEITRILIEDHDLFGSLEVRDQPAIATIAAQKQRHSKAEIWVVAEVLSGKIRAVSFELLGKASDLGAALGCKVAAVLLGRSVAGFAAELCARGADHVLVAEHPRLEPFDVEVHAAMLAAAIRTHQPRTLLFGSTTIGRDLAPRLAARLQLGLTGDCIDLGLDTDGRLIQYKPAFGGTVVAPILSKTVPEMATVRTGMMRSRRADSSRPLRIEQLDVGQLPEARVTISEQQANAGTAVDLDDCEIAIGVGMGFGNPENLAMARELASLLGAPVCTTRDVVDAGWLPRQLQVGLTGRAISPKLYIGVAIRGAFEHMVGVRRSGLIIAINKNPKAPVFKSADYGIVGDYREVLPALCRNLQAARG
ncbi:MAG TPA: FAD-binding protein [Candidatus Acidoferrales bacterium]|nr:FAD-binding protein [Candidatus Acidoferrales bacterium]